MVLSFIALNKALTTVVVFNHENSKSFKYDLLTPNSTAFA